MHYLTLKKPCSRCTRVDEMNVSLEEAAYHLNNQNQKSIPEAQANLEGLAFEFPKLCDVCKSIVRGYMDAAFKKLTKVSALHTAKVNIEED